MYGYQANVAHAYQILIKHGVHPENIITIMYDDAVNDTTNPFPGKLYNEPDGPDVYAGLKIDYAGFDVNVHNFLAVLEGNASAVSGGNGRVLESGPNDHVFVYMSAVGGPEIVFYKEELSPSVLSQTLTRMYEKKKYGKLVFYLDDPDASVFFEDILSPRINRIKAVRLLGTGKARLGPVDRDTARASPVPVYAVASHSRGEYLASDMYCGTSKFPEVCLATEFSHNWMKDADTNDLNNETLNDQFEIVKNNTRRSHVQRFGDLSIGDLPVASFLGHQQ